MTFIRVINMTIHEINIDQIKNYEGKKIELSGTVMPKTTALDGFSLAEPIEVCGSIRNFGGTLELEAKAHASLIMTCDRCADEYKTEFDFSISESFKETEDFTEDEENQNPDINYFSGDTLDIENIVYTALVLSLPSKHLCKEDCKGLCTECGTNLNIAECTCDVRSTDPRFDILDSLNLD